MDALRGPLHGWTHLPPHLGSSARAGYEFGAPPERALAYELVLLEAGPPAEHEQ